MSVVRRGELAGAPLGLVGMTEVRNAPDAGFRD